MSHGKVSTPTAGQVPAAAKLLDGEALHMDSCKEDAHDKAEHLPDSLSPEEGKPGEQLSTFKVQAGHGIMNTVFVGHNV